MAYTIWDSYSYLHLSYRIDKISALAADVRSLWFWARNDTNWYNAVSLSLWYAGSNGTPIQCPHPQVYILTVTSHGHWGVSDLHWQGYMLHILIMFYVCEKSMNFGINTMRSTQNGGHLADGMLQTQLVNNYSAVITSTMASQITGVSIVYLMVCSGARQRKHQNRWSVNSPHKGPVMRKMFPFDDVIKCKKFSDSWGSIRQ